MDEMTDQKRDARGMVVQPHGGALRPYPPRVVHGPWRSVRREAMALIRASTVEAIEILILRMRSDDERVSTVACEQILNRSLGKPTDLAQGDDDAGGTFDMAHLSSAERGELADALAVIMRLTGQVPG